MSPGQVDKQFWSVERAVAFVVAPIVTPLSGALALWLSQHFPGVHVSSTSIAAVASTTALGVAGGFIKWLDGRQKFVAQVGHFEGVAGLALKPVEAVIPEAVRKSLLAEIEGIVNKHVGELGRYVARKVGDPSVKGTGIVAEPAPLTSDPQAEAELASAQVAQSATDAALDPASWPSAAAQS